MNREAQITSTTESGEFANPQFPDAFIAGLEHLLQAHHYAVGTQRDVWDFAVEVDTLKETGVTVSDLRWLVCRGIIDHAREINSEDTNVRKFEPTAKLSFSRESCCLLTPVGAETVQEFFAARRASQRQEVGTANPSALKTQEHPKWDPDRHQLSVGNSVIKEFKLPAVNQETVLSAFEEEGWPPSIDDPLAPARNIDPKRRLHDTIKNLNRNQRQVLIRFMGDGTGEGVRWEFIASANNSI